MGTIPVGIVAGEENPLDDEILAFARGVLANEYQGIYSALDTERTVTTTVAIGGDDNQILVLARPLDSWSDTDPKTVSFAIWQMAETSTKVFKQYPSRFEETTLVIYTSDGRSVIGFARILAHPIKLEDIIPGNDDPGDNVSGIDELERLGGTTASNYAQQNARTKERFDRMSALSASWLS